MKTTIYLKKSDVSLNFQINEIGFRDEISIGDEKSCKIKFTSHILAHGIKWNFHMWDVGRTCEKLHVGRLKNGFKKVRKKWQTKEWSGTWLWREIAMKNVHNKRYLLTVSAHVLNRRKLKR